MIEQERLQKYIAKLGLMSRRKAEALIIQGKITVNNQVAIIGQKVSQKDVIKIQGKNIQATLPKTSVYMLNKPMGVIATTKDDLNRLSVTDIIKSKERLYPVGRLDKNTTGLILLTNDGDFAYHLTHPKFEIEKEYIVSLHRTLSNQKIDQIIQGIEIDGETLKADLIEKIGKNQYNIVLHEGKNREIRRMMQLARCEILSLERVRIGHLGIGDLRLGSYRKLTQEEIDLLVK